MRDFHEFYGSMHLWPEVAAMPGALKALENVGKGRIISLATNATDSREEEIWVALGRVSLDLLVNKVYCFRKVGFKKPAREFFEYILTDLSLDRDELVMVGDDFEKDILGANRSGIYGIWINLNSNQRRNGPMHDTISSLDDLPQAIAAREDVLSNIANEKKAMQLAKGGSNAMSDYVPIHFVSTHEEARKMAFAHDRFWVSNCGCREGNKAGCQRSRIDICLMYRNDIGSSGSGIKEIPLTELVAIFDEAVEKKLVTRPFRNDKDKSITDGICFCCDDCCGYFLNHDEKCDKGKHIETTDMDLCNFCGDCVPVCHFDARKMVDEELVLDRDSCYGCGLCLDTCAEKAISLAVR